MRLFEVTCGSCMRNETVLYYGAMSNVIWKIVQILVCATKLAPPEAPKICNLLSQTLQLEYLENTSERLLQFSTHQRLTGRQPHGL